MTDQLKGAFVDSAGKRQRYIDEILTNCGGAWPDLEGLIRDIYVAYLNKSDVVLDVGVNHGTHLFQMAEAVGPTGRVIGIEAVPAHVAAVQSLMEGPYGHLSDRIEMHSCAVSSKPGKAEFFVSQVNDGGLSGLHLRDVMAKNEFEKIEVDVLTIDQIVDEASNVCFVKIDVEGAEFDALSGAPKLLKHRPVIVFEFDETAPPAFNFSPSDLLDLFERNRLKVFDLFGFPVESPDALMSARVWNFVAVPTELDGAAITAPARRTLEGKFPTLKKLTPVPN